MKYYNPFSQILSSELILLPAFLHTALRDLLRDLLISIDNLRGANQCVAVCQPANTRRWVSHFLRKTRTSSSLALYIFILLYRYIPNISSPFLEVFNFIKITFGPEAKQNIKRNCHSRHKILALSIHTPDGFSKTIQHVASLVNQFKKTHSHTSPPDRAFMTCQNSRIQP